jgi:uncharacterized membrane protein YhaH (DUF805 family)
MALAIFVPYLTMCFILFAASVRRLHDSGKSMRPAVIVLGSLATVYVAMPVLVVLMLLNPNADLSDSFMGILAALAFVLILAFGLVGMFGSFWLLYLLFRRGTQGKNQYGPAPKKGQA